MATRGPRVDAGSLARRQRLALGNRGDDAVHAGIDPGRELALAEQRRHVFGNDPARCGVGQHALEAVSHLDAHLLVVLRDQEQRAVILALAPDLPFFRHTD